MARIRSGPWIRGLSACGLIGFAIGSSSTMAHAAPAQGNGVGAPITAAVSAPPAYKGLVGGPKSTATAEPGGTVTAAMSVGNTSTATIPKTYLFTQWHHGLKPTKTYDNCLYGDRTAFCEFATDVAPATQYVLNPQLQYDISEDTYAPGYLSSSSWWYTAEQVASRLDRWRATHPRRGTDGTLELQATSEPVSTPRKDQPWSSYAEIHITGNNPADLLAVGAKVQGAVGQTVKLKVSQQNLGPAVADFWAGVNPDLERFTLITVPVGTTVVTAPKNCSTLQDNTPIKSQPGSPSYVCSTDESLDLVLKPNTSQEWEFDLRIDRPGETRGKVETNYAWNGPRRHGKDSNPANDTAEIVVNEGSGPGGTGPGGTGTGGAGTGGADTGGTGTDGAGGLPVTGMNVSAIVGTGLVLVAAGVLAAMVVARRRRATRFVA